MELRYYQQDAVTEAWNALRRGVNPVIQLPTGAGKSLVISELAKRISSRGGRVCAVTATKELVSQNAAEFQSYSGIEPGVLCAGLKRTDKGHDVLFASVQSIYRPGMRGEIPQFDLVIVDECQNVADMDGEAKFYPQLFKSFHTAARLGLSATPSRMGEPVWGDGKYFDEKCYEVSVLELVHAGYLAPLIGVESKVQLDHEKIKTLAGEFDMNSAADQETDEWLSEVALTSKELIAGRKYIAVFCPTVDVAKRASKIFSKIGLAAKYVVGDCTDRDEKIIAWKAGEFPVLCSVNMLTTGFNHKPLDCIICIRPTQSSELWQQILGRGTRIANGKKDCLLIDFSGNLALHGGICVGAEEVYQQKPDGTLTRIDAAPRKRGERKVKRVLELGDADPLTANPRGVEMSVSRVSYMVIGSRNQPGKKLILAQYECRSEGGYTASASAFIMPEYSGYAKEVTKSWFARRGVENYPPSADGCLGLCYGLPIPRKVMVQKKGKYINVIKEMM